MKLPEFLPLLRFLLIAIGLLCFVLLMDILLDIRVILSRVPENTVLALAILTGCCFISAAISSLRVNQD